MPLDRSQVLKALEKERAGYRLQTARRATDNCVGLETIRSKIVTAVRLEKYIPNVAVAGSPRGQPCVSLSEKSLGVAKGPTFTPSSQSHPCFSRVIRRREEQEETV